MRTIATWLCLTLVLSSGCARKRQGARAGAKRIKIGIVTDVGGRGDQSFNDSALRGLELWASGQIYTGNGYRKATSEEFASSLPEDLIHRDPPIAPLDIIPVVLQSKSQEDYEPNLQLLVDQGCTLTIGVGFMVENAVEAVAKRNPGAKFLLIDSPILDTHGRPYVLPNVETVVFREEQGSFLVGAIAGQVTSANDIAFVGGMEIPLIKKFEAGFRAGVMTVNRAAGERVRVSYTGSFDNVAAGKQVAEDLLSKGTDVVFHAAGSDGVGVIHAVKEVRAQGKRVFAIGVDSDQYSLAPEAMLTSMVKRVDLAVFDSIHQLLQGRYRPGDRAMGLAEAGVAYAPVRLDFPGKGQMLQKVEALKAKVIAGQIKVPSNIPELTSFLPAP